MAQVNVRIDDDLKICADALFDELGLNMSTAMNTFFKQAVCQGGIPFEITTNGDPFWSEKNQKRIRKSIAEFEAGKAKLVTKTMEELENMANG